MRKAPGRPSRGRYLVHNPLLLAWLAVVDAALRLLPRRRPAVDPRTVRQVLVAVGGHLGDAVMATAALANVQRLFPSASIGIVTGSWNGPVFDGHPRVARVHVRDHWKLARDGGLLARLVASWRSGRAARRAIAGAGYDVAIDLSPYYPNAAVLLWRSGVPVRAGFTSGGRGALYTHAVEWRATPHATSEHVLLLQAIAASFEPASIRYELATVDPLRGRATLRGAGVHGEYVVFHVGAGHARKEWPLDRWAEVVSAVSGRGLPVVLTGTGARQRSMAGQLSARAAVHANLVDRLDWTSFREVIAGARTVLTVDTVAAHLAAAENVPCVVVMAALDDPSRWRALGEQVAVLTQPVSCAPCYRSRGCAAMSCVRDVPVEAVLAAAVDLITGPRAARTTA